MSLLSGHDESERERERLKSQEDRKKKYLNVEKAVLLKESRERERE